MLNQVEQETLGEIILNIWENGERFCRHKGCMKLLAHG